MVIVRQRRELHRLSSSLNGTLTQEGPLTPPRAPRHTQPGGDPLEDVTSSVLRTPVRGVAADGDTTQRLLSDLSPFGRAVLTSAAAAAEAEHAK